MSAQGPIASPKLPSTQLGVKVKTYKNVLYKSRSSAVVGHIILLNDYYHLN